MILTPKQTKNIKSLSVVELLAFIHVMELILADNGEEVDQILAEMEA